MEQLCVNVLLLQDRAFACNEFSQTQNINKQITEPNVIY